MTAPAAERCPTCDRPRAGEDAASHDDGCVCDLCLSVCWRSWGGQCDEVDWRARALTAEARIATVAAAVEHDVAVKRSHDDARSAGGQTVGTGGPLTPAPQSVLRYLDRVVLRLSDPRIRTIADDADRWAKVAPLIERLRAIDAEANRSKTTGTRVHELRVEHFDTVRALLAATEPTP